MTSMLSSLRSRRFGDPRTGELAFADPIRNRIAEQARLVRRTILWRSVALGLVISTVGTYLSAFEPTHLVPELVAATAAVSGLIGVYVALDAPVAMALRLIRTCVEKQIPVEPSRSFLAATGLLMMLPMSIPLYLAIHAPLPYAVVLTILLPFTSIVSGSMVRSTLSLWHREIAQLAMARRWESSTGPAR